MRVRARIDRRSGRMLPKTSESTNNMYGTVQYRMLQREEGILRRLYCGIYFIEWIALGQEACMGKKSVCACVCGDTA